MSHYPRYFKIDGKFITLRLEDDEIVGYDNLGKQFSDVSRALSEGVELTRQEFDTLSSTKSVEKETRTIVSWEDLFNKKRS